MESFSQLTIEDKLILLGKYEYNTYTHAHIIFYHKNEEENKYHFLFHKDDTSSKYSDVNSEFNSQDPSNIFCGARIILDKLYGSLSNKIFKKLNDNEELTSDDILSEVTICLEFFLIFIRNLIGLS